MQWTRWLALALLANCGAISSIRADDWPQWLGPKRDGVWRETGIVDKFPAKGPNIRWRVPVGMGYSGPAVANGKVYLTDRFLGKDVKNPDNPFARDAVEGTERVLCLDARTKRLIWKHEYPCVYEVSYPAGPRCTPVVANGKVYTLGAMGDLICLDAAKGGKPIWSKNFPKEYEAPVPLWGFAAHPLVDADKLICLVGGKGSAVVAFHKDTGKEIWKKLTTRDVGYCPPILITAGGKRQLIIWHPEAIVSLNPDNGEEYWTQACNIRASLTIPTPRHEGDYLLFSAFYNGSMLLKLDRDKPAATVVWKGKHFQRTRPGSEEAKNTDGLHSIMSTPFLKDGTIYGVCSYGHLRGLKVTTGKRLWETLLATGGKVERWANAFIVAQGERYFLFNEQGDLIIAKMTAKGYEEISRAHILDPTNKMARNRFSKNPNRLVVWTHPAFADKAMFARSDKELVCVDLAKDAK